MHGAWGVLLPGALRNSSNKWRAACQALVRRRCGGVVLLRASMAGAMRASLGADAWNLCDSMRRFPRGTSRRDARPAIA